jgi:hypothetical protein
VGMGRWARGGASGWRGAGEGEGLGRLQRQHESKKRGGYAMIGKGGHQANVGMGRWARGGSKAKRAAVWVFEWNSPEGGASQSPLN